MRILILGYEHSKEDKRTLRSFEALKELGEVFYQYMSDSEEKISDSHFIPLSRPSKSYEPISWILKWLVFDSRIKRLIKSLKPDIVYFHYLPFAGVKLFEVAKKLGAKIIFEVHEIIPDQFMKSYKIVDIIRPILWNVFKKALSLSDGLIFVSEESVEYIFNKCSIKKDYFVIPNYAQYSLTPKKYVDREKSVVIVGKVARSLETEHRLLKFLTKMGFNIKLIGWEGEASYLKNLDNINMEKLPFLPYNVMMDEINKVMFSLISFTSNPRKRIIQMIFIRFLTSFLIL